MLSDIIKIRKKVRKIIEEQFLSDENLIEGLIMTHDIQKSSNIINKIFKGTFNAEPKKTKNIIVINFLQKGIDFEKINKLIKTINNLGYFISYYFINKQNYKFINDESLIKSYTDSNADENSKFYLIIEAKFDYYDFKTNRYLYHITESKFVPKIQKIGLVPKSKSKATYHPDRIYLTRSKSGAMELFFEFVNANLNSDFNFNNYRILKIDTKIIPNLKLYNDPNANKKGVYTLDNIPKEAIVEILEIKDEDI